MADPIEGLDVDLDPVAVAPDPPTVDPDSLAVDLLAIDPAVERQADADVDDAEPIEDTEADLEVDDPSDSNPDAPNSVRSMSVGPSS